ncbi:toprim domain-containing protein [Mastigocoleus sp. MO_188.B34]|uniref:toprim domain-containing protein n=1 Tax=Mastigocoleus sp. MO_188.B34 TaxID=3036635 RepID=UPI00260C1547|nr:toprim domain-containing protein [Mastigocoleus sp. MO_188.B34]MDJ0696920.1 toprim domain-containing protein [Mastigocoleus sp. MO_188.B34]
MLEPDALQSARPVLRGRGYSDIILLPDHSLPIVAYDNDAPGQEMANEVMKLISNAVRKGPNAKDWNEDLKNIFDFATKKEISEQQQQSNEHGFNI